MGCCAVSYKRNAIPLADAKPMYYLPIEEASVAIDWNHRPSWSEVVDVTEFDTKRYQFNLKDGSWFVVQGTKSTMWTN